jgi:hypothetical protein
MQLASENSDCFVKYYHSFTYAEKVYIIMELCEWGVIKILFSQWVMCSKKEKFLHNLKSATLFSS